MPSQTTPQIILTHFDWSLARFKESIENEDTEYYREAALHRFKLTYDVALETIRAFAKGQGQICSTEESCFQWVKGKQWLGNGINPNIMQANYQKIQNQPKSEEVYKIYGELQAYYILLNQLSDRMKLAKE